LNKSIKIIINWVIGPLLAVWLFYSLYNQVKQQQGLYDSIQLIKQAPFGKQAALFWLIVLLAFCNWGLESRKWQILITRIQPMKFFTAVKSVLSGIALSLNTPNRIGEYGGRVLFVQEGKRLQAVSLSIAGGIAQLIITMLMGSIGLIVAVSQMPEGGQLMGLSEFWVQTFTLLSFLGTTFLGLFFFKLSWLIRLIDKLPYAEKFEKYINILEKFTAKFLLRLLSLSFFRYIIFVLQYVLMLQLLNVQIDWWQGFWTITVLFWVLAVVPTIAIAELGIRGKFAVALLNLYSNNVVGIIGTTFGIWFINLFIPAIIGSILILGTKIFKEK
jgi:hypothetical protein